jgi:ribosomal protein S18 acetylase RimI-like enzyme
MNIELYEEKVAGELMDLLLLADPNEEAIAAYLHDATIYVAYESNRLVGVAVITFDKDQAELKNIAVDESHQGKGIAKALVFNAQRYAKENGAVSIKVGTGNSSLSQLALYQKCGFRMQSIKRGYFSGYPEPIMENGIRCLDMVVLCAKL